MSIEGEEQRTYPLNQIYFYLTKGCNLRCRHCWITPKFQTGETKYPVLDVGLFQNIIEQAKPLGLSGVKLTGGEPLLHPDILKLIDIVVGQDLRLTMETNGILCTPEVAGKISKAKNPHVSVSIDGAKAETHEWVRGVEGAFGAALKGVEALVENNLRPQIIMALMRCNRDQMEDIVRLAESIGAGSVKFNIVQPTARGETLHQGGQTLGIQELVEIGRWVENELKQSAKIPVFYGQPIAFRPMSKMFGDNGDGCGICGIKGIIGVLADGSYALCGIGETVSELIFGHAAKDSLEKVWNNNPVLEEIRQGIPEKLKGVCGDCLMKGLCLGSCVAQNYYASRSLWEPYWFCDAANKANLFPETRVKRN